jgi:hypothetical protein
LQSPSGPDSKPIANLAGVTGESEDPTRLAWRFSPVSNEKWESISPDDELRVLITTDVLSEGQNLQDCAVVINYDLPWAIIRLIQRVGRVDRIGQQAESIRCYSFLPADGVERIIRLRSRVRQRLHENAEVVGTDEAFFEDDSTEQTLRDLYTEKSGLLDGETDTEVDLASYAYQIWKNALEADPGLAKLIPDLPNVIFATRRHTPSPSAPPGVLVYMRTADDNDALTWVGPDGANVTQSQLAILNAARCDPDTPALPRRPDHHDLVARGAAFIVEEERSSGGGLGRPSGARFRTYERLKAYADHVRGSLFDFPELHRAIDHIYQYPLRPSAVDTLNRQLRAGIEDDKLAELVIALYEEGRLCSVAEQERTREPQIICSMGLASTQEG